MCSLRSLSINEFNFFFLLDAVAPLKVKKSNDELTHSLLRLVKPTFPIELNRKQKHFQRNAIIVENYYCIANTSVTTKLHVLKICKLWFSFLIL